MVKGYSATQIALHWVIAVLIIGQLIFGDDMTHVWRTFRRTGDATLTTMAWAHIIAGVLVLAFVIWRLALRLTRGAPASPEGSALVTLIGRATHGLLYLLMVAAPVSGLLAWYGNISAAGEIHELMKPALILLIGLHVLGALYHQFVVKDNLLNRMRQAG